MTLDLSALVRAVAQLGEGLVTAKADPGNELLRDGVIQRFEYTYELSHKMRRHLAATEASAATIDGLSFPDLIRLGSERALLLSGWDRWKVYRAARGTTSHTYDAEKARQVFAHVPDFLAEAQHLLDRAAAAGSSAMSRGLDIAPEHLKLVRSLLQEHAPRPSTVWAFGSRVLGSARLYSDLDLAIDAGRPLTLAEQADLASAFEDAALPWRVDVVDWAAASEPFRRLIEHQRVALSVLPGAAGDAGAADVARH